MQSTQLIAFPKDTKYRRLNANSVHVCLWKSKGVLAELYFHLAIISLIYLLEYWLFSLISNACLWCCMFIQSSG